MYIKWVVDTDHCRSWLASEDCKDDAFIQTARVIVDDHRWQASSYRVELALGYFTDFKNAAVSACTGLPIT